MKMKNCGYDYTDDNLNSTLRLSVWFEDREYSSNLSGVDARECYLTLMEHRHSVDELRAVIFGALRDKVLRKFVDQQKELDERKRAVTRPLDEAKRNALALFTPLETQLKAAEASLKQAILAYNRQVEAARAAGRLNNLLGIK